MYRTLAFFTVVGFQMIYTHAQDTAQCKEPYGTTAYGVDDGRPAYSSSLPDCTGEAVDANGVVLENCLCSRCGDIRVIVAIPGEKCDTDGFWDAKASDIGYYQEGGSPKERDTENFGYEDNCDIQCEEAYNDPTKQNARDAGAATTRRFLRNVVLKATQEVNGESVNYVCLPAEFADRAHVNQGGQQRKFECTGCKKCKDDAENFDFGYKHSTYEFEGKLYGGCYPWCKNAYEDLNRGPAKICRWKKCSGCTKCVEYSNADSHEGNAYDSSDLEMANKDTSKTQSLFKFKVPNEDILLDGVLHGGCFPFCRNGFFDANRGPTKVCYWKKCSGCKACTLYAENHNDETNDGFRYKINTQEVDTNDNDRKTQTNKKHGGCLRHCKNSAVTKGLEKICKWRGCSGCEVCKPGAVAVDRIPATVKNAAVNKVDGEEDGDFQSIGDILYKAIASNKWMVPRDKRDDYSTSATTVNHQAKLDIATLFERHAGDRKGDCPSVPSDCKCAGIVCIGKCSKDNCKGCAGCIR